MCSNHAGIDALKNVWDVLYNCSNCIHYKDVHSHNYCAVQLNFCAVQYLVFPPLAFITATTRRGTECTSFFKRLPVSAFHSRFNTSNNAALLVGRGRTLVLPEIFCGIKIWRLCGPALNTLHAWYNPLQFWPYVLDHYPVERRWSPFHPTASWTVSCGESIFVYTFFYL